MRALTANRYAHARSHVCAWSRTLLKARTPLIKQRSTDWACHCQLDPARKKMEAPVNQKVRPEPVNNRKDSWVPGTTLNDPRLVTRISHAELDSYDSSPGQDFWGLGQLKAPRDTALYDWHSELTQPTVQTRRPGQGRFKWIRRGHYDVRPLKYLFTVDQRGVNIAREMKPCKSTRGIALHSKISMKAVVGGEVWFKPDDKHAVVLNLNSGRFPPPDDGAWDKLGKLWVALGYDNVYVVPRGQRYGEVTPLLYLRASEPKPES
jgi:hypothetical protein